MKVNVERIENAQMVLEVEVDPEEEEEALQDAYCHLVKKAEVPGFRKGKAPRAMFERFVGREVLLQEAIERMVPRLLNKAIEEREITPIAQPEVEVTGTEPVAFKATVPLSPTVEVEGYRDIRVPKEPVEVTEEQVDRAIDELREQFGSWSPVDRPVQMGDLVTMDVEGKVGDENVDKREGIQYQVMADDAFPVPGFAEKLVGLEKGKEAEFTISFPADHERGELAGQDCWFKVLISEIKEKQLPEADDEFAKSVSEEFDTIQALRERIASNLREMAEEQATREYEEKVIDKVVEQATVEFPPFLVERDIDSMIAQQERGLQANRMSLEQYLARSQMTGEQLREQLRPVAAKRVARTLVLSKVMEEEGIEATDEQIEEQTETLVRGAGERGEEARQFFTSPIGRQSLQQTLLGRNTVQRLVEIASGEADKAPSEESGGGEMGGADTEAESAESTEKEAEEDA
ncbi:MAG: trigger factor [Chloroflexota bacterium]